MQVLLLVETSYRRRWRLTGGGIERSETARKAAVRELTEEVGLRVRVRAEQLLEPWQICERCPGGFNTVTIFTLPLQTPPLPGKMTPLHSDHIHPPGGLMEQSNASLKRDDQS